MYYGRLTYFPSGYKILTSVSHFILAMTLHPEVLVKAQEEIDSVVGNDRLPGFSDRPNLPYGKFYDSSNQSLFLH